VTEFIARVGTPEGAVVLERHRSSNADSLRRELEAKGLHVFHVNTARTRFRIPLLRREKLAPLDFLVFNQQLATLLRAGIPVLQSLELLQRSQTSAYFREVLSRVLDDVRSGVALSDSFAGQGELFPRLYSATLLAGERSGDLVAVLDRYITYQQMMEAVRRRVTTALTYPAVLLALACGLVVLLMTYVIPRFAEFYIGFAGELPLPTLIVMTAANWLKHNMVYIVPSLVVVALVVRRWLRTESGRLAVDRLQLRLPFLGKVFHLFSLSQFIRSLATLLAGGTPLVNALEVATSTVTNIAVSVPLRRVAPRVREGQALWVSLQGTQLFPELSLAMVQVGEATGALEGMLFNVSRFYDESIEVRLGQVVSLIEPLVLVLMGCIIAGLLMTVYLPMFTMLQKAQ
jgi:type IV pilus assembly protein PilC